MSVLSSINLIKPASIYGCQTEWVSTSAIKVLTGNAWDSTSQINIVVSSDLTLTKSVVGPGGLDTGTLQNNTTYYVYLIADSTNNNPVDAVFSVDPETPFLATGYDAYRWVGQFRTDGSGNILRFSTVGNGEMRTHWLDFGSEVLAAGAATTLADVGLGSAGLPFKGQTNVWIQVAFTPAAPADTVTILPLNSSEVTGQQKFNSCVAAVADIKQAKILAVPDSTELAIRYINSAAACATQIVVRGWEYYL